MSRGALYRHLNHSELIDSPGTPISCHARKILMDSLARSALLRLWQPQFSRISHFPQLLASRTETWIDSLELQYVGADLGHTCLHDELFLSV